MPKAVELFRQRTVNSKAFLMPNGRIGLDIHLGGDIHYKNNYADKFELWKDIELVWEGNRITKAPYELTLEGNKVTVREKKSGEVSTIELLEIGGIPIPAQAWEKSRGLAKAFATDLEIIVENTRVKFSRILKSDEDSKEAKYKVTGKIPLQVRAGDQEDELPIEWNLKDEILTETLKLTRPVKYPARVDPTLDLQVRASADDLRIYNNGANWVASSLTHAAINVGYVNSGALKQGNGLRFQNVTVPNGLTISTASLIMTARLAQSNGDVNSVVIGEDVDDAAIFSDLADYQARRGVIVGGANDNYITSASVNWNAIPAWSVDEEGADTTSPEIKTIIQEIVNRGGWTSGNALVLFWDDHAGNSTAANNTFRSTYSYDGSSTKCVKLHIEYLAQAVGDGAVAIAGALSSVRTFVQAVGNGAVAIVGALSITSRTFVQSVGGGTVAIVGSLGRLWAWVSLKLQKRPTGLTLQARSASLTLQKRPTSLTLPEGD